MKKIKRTLQTIFLAAACYTFSACGSATDVTYLQDLHPNVMIELQKVQEIKLQPGDKLSIVVHSRDNELAQMFNLSSYNTESAKVSSNSSNSYTIDNQGTSIPQPVRLFLHRLIRFLLPVTQAALLTCLRIHAALSKVSHEQRALQSILLLPFG